MRLLFAHGWFFNDAAAICSWLIFLFEDFAHNILIDYSVKWKKKDQILIGCIFWRWDCARVRFPAGMKCGLNYLKGKGLKTIRIISFRIVLTNISFSIVLTNHNQYMKLSSFCSSKIMSFLLILTLYLLSFFLILMHCLKPIPFCLSYGNLSYYKFPRFWTEERGNRTTCHKAYIRSYIGKNLLSWPYIFFLNLDNFSWWTAISCAKSCVNFIC